MAAEKLVLDLAKRINRRKLLAKAGVGAVGALAVAIGKPLSAAALVAYKCCDLCCFPYGCSNCTSTWCWQCCNDVSDGVAYQCCECYGSSGDCGPSCSGVIGSCVSPSGWRCFRPPAS
jgi:hypothetical protein